MAAPGGQATPPGKAGAEAEPPTAAPIPFAMPSAAMPGVHGLHAHSGAEPPHGAGAVAKPARPTASSCAPSTPAPVCSLPKAEAKAFSSSPWPKGFSRQEGARPEKEREEGALISDRPPSSTTAATLFASCVCNASSSRRLLLLLSALPARGRRPAGVWRGFRCCHQSASFTASKVSITDSRFLSMTSVTLRSARSRAACASMSSKSAPTWNSRDRSRGPRGSKPGSRSRGQRPWSRRRPGVAVPGGVAAQLCTVRGWGESESGRDFTSPEPASSPGPGSCRPPPWPQGRCRKATRPP
mmetsp:Transcript_96387/g.300776  ORF Transcript_96387/g.300776 Transcript_96387/m.300776 type:complete len:298 (-) Transcript_96387:66-959(-)